MSRDREPRRCLSVDPPLCWQSLATRGISPDREPLLKGKINRQEAPPTIPCDPEPNIRVRGRGGAGQADPSCGAGRAGRVREIKPAVVEVRDRPQIDDQLGAGTGNV